MCNIFSNTSISTDIKSVQRETHDHNLRFVFEHLILLTDIFLLQTNNLPS